MARAGARALLFCACACGASTLRVSTDEPRARVFLDGTELPASRPAAGVPLPYHGTIAFDVFPAETPKQNLRRDAVRRLHTIDEPVSPWFFPFDLPLEALQRAFAGPQRSEARIEVPTLPGVVPEATPPASEELRARSNAMRVAR